MRAIVYCLGVTISLSFFGIQPTACWGYSPQSQIEFTDGSTRQLPWLAVDRQWIEVRDPQSHATRKIPLKEIAAVRGNQKQRPTTNYPMLQMSDGSRLVVASLKLQDNQLDVSFADRPRQKFSTRQVLGATLRAPENASEYQKTFVATREEDSILAYRNGELTAIEGVIRSMDARASEGSLTFSIGERSAEVAINKLAGFTFYQPAQPKRDTPAASCLLTDGSVIPVQRCSHTDGKLKLTSVGGLEFEMPLSLLSSIEVGRHSRVALSQLAPSTNDWQPLIASNELVASLRKLRVARQDRDYANQPLSLRTIGEGGSTVAQTRTYDNGFAMQGGCRLAFKLAGQYDRLTGLVGFSPDAHREGQVRLKISADGNRLLDRVLSNQQMAAAIQIDLPLNRCERLLITVDYGDGRSVGDTIHLVNLKLAE